LTDVKNAALSLQLVTRLADNLWPALLAVRPVA